MVIPSQSTTLPALIQAVHSPLPEMLGLVLQQLECLPIKVNILYLQVKCFLLEKCLTKKWLYIEIVEYMNYDDALVILDDTAAGNYMVWDSAT